MNLKFDSFSTNMDKVLVLAVCCKDPIIKSTCLFPCFMFLLSLIHFHCGNTNIDSIIKSSSIWLYIFRLTVDVMVVNRGKLVGFIIIVILSVLKFDSTLCAALLPFTNLFFWLVVEICNLKGFSTTIASM